MGDETLPKDLPFGRPGRVTVLADATRVIRSLSPGKRVMVLYLVPLSVLGAFSFAGTMLALDAHQAFDILIGAKGGAGSDAGIWAFVLAAVGYLFLPAIASLMVASAWSNQ